MVPAKTRTMEGEYGWRQLMSGLGHRLHGQSRTAVFWGA
jgi:hypothetical protein